jgi:hypothetical protein
MSNSAFFAVFNSSLPSATLNITEALAPRLVSKLHRTREWLREEDACAFSDATFNRVMDLLARHRELLPEIDAAAGSDGSIGILFERGVERLYADFLNNGRIRLFIRGSDGVDRKSITENDDLVSSSLSRLSPVFENIIEIRAQGASFLLNVRVSVGDQAEASYALPPFPEPIYTV